MDPTTKVGDETGYTPYQRLENIVKGSREAKF
jgi:hypothetical protein